MSREAKVGKNFLRRTTLQKLTEKLKKKPLIFYIFILWAVLGAFFIYLNFPLLSQNFNYYFNKKHREETENKGISSSNKSTENKIENVRNSIVISKINVDAPIVEAQSTKDADILKALENGVAHYPTTSLPGETGNAFITGHSSNFRWAKGNYNYVFTLLNKLQKDDIIIAYWGGRKYVYKVFDIKVVSPKDVSVLDQTSESIISLMTCDPPGTTWKRRVVRGLQIEPDPKTNKPWQSRLNMQGRVNSLIGN